MHPTYRFRFTPLGLALLFTVRDTHEGLSVSVCPSTVCFWSHQSTCLVSTVSPAVLYARDSLRIDNKLRTGALRSTRTRDLVRNT